MNMFCKHKYSIINGYSTYDEDFCYEFTCVKCNKRIKLYTSDLQNDLSKLRNKYNESNTDNLGLLPSFLFLTKKVPKIFITKYPLIGMSLL